MKFISPAVTRKIARQILVTKKNSPHIFFVGGVIGVVGSAVLACRATLKLEAAIDEIKHDVDMVKEIVESDDNVIKIQKGQEAYKDFGYVYVKSAIVLGKLYGPSILLGAASVAALTGSHVQLTRRNAALSATLALVSKAYDDYRERVKEEIGKDRELDIYRATKNQEVEVDGKKKIVKLTDPNGISPYARFFDEISPCWVKNAEMNRMFLECQQRYANHRLQARGHVFLNEVYDALGLEHSQAGAVVGWVIGDEGDNYIDFGMYEAGTNSFINNIEPRILLDFNVDGVVYDKI